MTIYLKDQLASPEWGNQIINRDPIDLCVGKKLEGREICYRNFVDSQEMNEAGYKEMSINEIYEISQNILSSTIDKAKKPIVERNVKALYSMELKKLKEEYEEINGLLPNIVKIASFILFPLFWIGAFIQESQDAAKENLYGFMNKVWKEITLEMTTKSLKIFEGTKPAEYFKEVLSDHILNPTIDQVNIGGTSINVPGNIARDLTSRLSDLRLNGEDLTKKSLETIFEKISEALGEKVENAPITKLALLTITQVGLGDVEIVNAERGLGFSYDLRGDLHSIDIKDDRLSITTTGLVYQKDKQGKTLGAKVFKRQFTVSIHELKKAIDTGDLNSLTSLKGEDLISESLLVREKGESLEEMPTLINTDKKTLTLSDDEYSSILKGVEQATKNSL